MVKRNVLLRGVFWDFGFGNLLSYIYSKPNWMNISAICEGSASHSEQGGGTRGSSEVPVNIKYSEISVKTSELFFQLSANPLHVQNHTSLDLLRNAMRASSGYDIGAVLLWPLWVHFGFAYHVVKGY